MASVGFSTGALAKGDFRRGIELQRRPAITAIELSALRVGELDDLLSSLGALDLGQFSHVSFHAPSSLEALREAEVVEKIRRLVPREWPVILHPDVIGDFSLWQTLEARLCLENMDQRKPIGRTVRELKRFFRELPAARFCLDLGHARQVDPTMTEAMELLDAFGARLAQIHVSEVDDASRHVALSSPSIRAFQRMCRYIEADCPWIIESQVAPAAIDREIENVRACQTCLVPSVERRRSLAY